MVSEEKKGVIKESIRRLLELGISDREVIDNLGSVGIDVQSARGILQETKDELSGKPKNVPQQAQPVQQQGQQAPRVKQGRQGRGGDEKVDADSITDDIYGLSEEEESGLKTPVISKPINNPQYDSQNKPAQKPVGQGQVPGQSRRQDDSEDLAELWEKGIMTTVNARLAEMKQIKEDLNAVLDRKISERVQVESKKIETVMDSQRTLFYSKIDAHLDAKADELKRVLESKARQLEDVNAKLNDQISRISAEKKFTSEILATINQKAASIDATRSQMISETNSSLLSMETKFNSFMSESARKRDDIEQRIKNSLQLETTITEGVVANAKQVIDSMRLEKEQELTRRVEAKVKELDELTRLVDAKGVTQKLMQIGELEQRLGKKEKDIDLRIERLYSENEKAVAQGISSLRKEFEAYKKEISRVNTGNLEEIEKAYAKSVDDLFAQHLVAWNKAIAEKKKEIDALKAEVDVEKYNATLDALGEFKEQFLNTVKKNIQDYNKSKKELAQSIIERDKAINDYLRKIDAKLLELTEFKKGFSKDVHDLLSVIPESESERRRK
ncbi:Uncharacterised protein [uncultured archaeon]|nr:Uncharacterised protein [uncultured archaeon]